MGSLLSQRELGARGSESWFHRVTFPDSGQNKGGKSHFSKAMAPGDVKYKG